MGDQCAFSRFAASHRFLKIIFKNNWSKMIASVASSVVCAVPTELIAKFNEKGGDFSSLLPNPKEWVCTYDLEMLMLDG